LDHHLRGDVPQFLLAENAVTDIKTVKYLLNKENNFGNNLHLNH
jgi:hypothetical protein